MVALFVFHAFRALLRHEKHLYDNYSGYNINIKPAPMLGLDDLALFLAVISSPGPSPDWVLSFFFSSFFISLSFVAYLWLFAISCDAGFQVANPWDSKSPDLFSLSDSASTYSFR